MRGFVHALDERALIVFQKDQLRAIVVQVHGDQIAQLDLPGGQKIRERENQEALDGPLQMARAEFGVRAFAEQEIAGRARCI